MSEPIAPPSESGWYVVETRNIIDLTKVEVVYLEVTKRGTVGLYKAGLESVTWEDRKEIGMDCILRYRKFDPAAYLDGATKEGDR